MLRSRSGHIEYYTDEVLNMQFYNDGIYINIYTLREIVTEPLSLRAKNDKQLIN